jgi:hypothetical protein
MVRRRSLSKKNLPDLSPTGSPIRNTSWADATRIEPKGASINKILHQEITHDRDEALPPCSTFRRF